MKIKKYHRFMKFSLKLLSSIDSAYVSIISSASGAAPQNSLHMLATNAYYLISDYFGPTFRKDSSKLSKVAESSLKIKTTWRILCENRKFSPILGQFFEPFFRFRYWGRRHPNILKTICLVKFQNGFRRKSFNIVYYYMQFFSE